jgi:hypothetical protein
VLVGISTNLYDAGFRDDLVTMVGQWDRNRPGIHSEATLNVLQTRSEVQWLIRLLSEYYLRLFVGTINVLMAIGILFGATYICAWSRVRKVILPG